MPVLGVARGGTRAPKMDTHRVNTEIERIGAINNPGRCWAGGKCPTNKSIASFEDSFQMKVPVSVPPFFVDLRHAMRSTKINHVTFHPPQSTCRLFQDSAARGLLPAVEWRGLRIGRGGGGVYPRWNAPLRMIKAK